MSIEEIKDFADGLKQLAIEKELMHRMVLMMKQQLLIIIANGGKLTQLEHPDLRTVDWDKIELGVGMTSASAYALPERKRITSWDDVPCKQTISSK